MFETEVVILAEVGLPSYRVENYSEQENDVALLENFDFLDEKCDQAAICLAAQKNLVARGPSPTKVILPRRPSLEESLLKYSRAWCQSIWPRLGRPVQSGLNHPTRSV